ncbi:Crp/Fnr family transcriptional regulator [Sphingosinithalassobacter portus]|uniref:Crp/Fnr family transcriptional regulator n=1 Tax=Stakelama portus TaxID=2676234 RepID=UPI00137AF9A1|nr:Crp/Fnr family transcriptional regulator [Sphingosinithalassobacter portus]
MSKLFYVGAPPLHALLDEATCAALRKAGRQERHAAGTVLYERGDQNGAMVVIEEGEVEVGNFDLSGQFLPTSRMGPGHCFGEGAMLSGLPRTFSARAVTAVAVAYIDESEYRGVVAEFPAIAEAVTRIMAQRFQLLLEFVDDLRTQPFNVQVAKALLTVSGIHEVESAIAVGPEELAVMLGASSVAVTQALGRLERERLVLRTPDGVLVQDRNMLAEWIRRRTSRNPVLAPEATAPAPGFAARRAMPRAG